MLKIIMLTTMIVNAEPNKTLTKKISETDYAPKLSYLEKPFSIVNITKVASPILFSNQTVEKIEIPKTIKSIVDIKEQKNIVFDSSFSIKPQKESDSHLVPYVEMSDSEQKLILAKIYNEIVEDKELAFALFAQLINDKTYSLEAEYSYAIIAREFDLPTEYRSHMINVAKNVKKLELRQSALSDLMAHADLLSTKDVEKIDSLIEEYKINYVQYDKYSLLKAKYYLEKGDLTQVQDNLLLIENNSSLYTEAQILYSLMKYRAGKLDEAIALLEISLEQIKNNSSKSEFVNLAKLTLARMQFQKGEYQKSFESYQTIDKNSSFWLVATVEQAWAQILFNDFEGAAGNMFSLHTDFFKNAFSPDSYTARTVGYLNLCQFGDSIKALNDMKKKYGQIYERLEGFKKTHPNGDEIYNTIKVWVKNPQLKEVEGLPRQLIVELAKDPLFIKNQMLLNKIEDESEKLNKVILNLIQIEKRTLQAQSEATQEIYKIKENLGHQSDKANSSFLARKEALELKVQNLKNQYALSKSLRSTVKEINNSFSERTEKEKGTLKIQLAKNLTSTYSNIQAQLKKQLDQSELLEYEIYSGAGEHLRYQLSGGDVKEKDSKEITSKTDKNLKWKFKGEIWEDEVGHFRSSLKNVCPTTNASNN